MEQTVKFTVFVANKTYELKFFRIYLKNNELIVVSELRKLLRSIQTETKVLLEAKLNLSVPDRHKELAVKHYLIDGRHALFANGQNFTPIEAEQIKDLTVDAKLIWDKEAGPLLSILKPSRLATPTVTSLQPLGHKHWFWSNNYLKFGTLTVAAASVGLTLFAVKRYLHSETNCSINEINKPKAMN